MGIESTWEFELRADDRADLANLADVFGDGEPAVRHQDSGRWSLCMSVDEETGTSAAIQLAESALRRMEGAIRLLQPDYGGVQLTGTIETNDGRVHCVVAVSAARLSFGARQAVSKSSLLTGRSDRSRRLSPRSLLLAQQSDVVRDLLRYAASKELDWVELYKIFEVVRDAVKPDDLRKRSWVDGLELSRFTWSSQEHRHHKPSGERPSNPMTLSEAREFVMLLARSYIDSISLP